MPPSVVSPPRPFALSLSKGRAERVEALGVRREGFDRLSPNGFLRTLTFAPGWMHNPVSRWIG
jgi:hypothetical protein